MAQPGGLTSGFAVALVCNVNVVIRLPTALAERAKLSKCTVVCANV